MRWVGGWVGGWGDAGGVATRLVVLSLGSQPSEVLHQVLQSSRCNHAYILIIIFIYNINI